MWLSVPCSGCRVPGLGVHIIELRRVWISHLGGQGSTHQHVQAGAVLKAAGEGTSADVY